MEQTTGSNQNGNGQADGQLQVRFVTKDQQYSIGSNVFAIDRNLTVEGLNKIVNSVIRSTNEQHEDVEFNFLTNRYLIKKKFNEHLDLILSESGEEKIIEVEYLIRNEPPEPFKSLNYLDWVGSIHSNDRYILSGCYDGSVNIYSIEKSKHILSIDAHPAAIKCVRILNSDHLSQHFTTRPNELYFITASNDESCKIWKWVDGEKDLNLLYTCKGHSRSVEGIDIYQDLFVTGGNDNLLKIWFMSNESFTKDAQPEEDDTESRKSKKMKSIESSIKYPYTTLAGHNEGITDVCWLNDSDRSAANGQAASTAAADSIPDLASSSLDSTIKIWDTETFELKATLPGPKAILSLDYSPKTRLIISGLCDNHLRTFDPRAKEGNIVKAAYSSHTGWITSVKWQSNSDYLFISGSFDTKVKQWDLRSTKAPLFDLVGHEGRVLAVDWTNPGYICSGASDSFMKVYKIN